MKNDKELVIATERYSANRGIRYCRLKPLVQCGHCKYHKEHYTHNGEVKILCEQFYRVTPRDGYCFLAEVEDDSD